MLFTIGHSNHPIEAFLSLLERACGARLLVDVRRYPGSRRHPHFGRGPLEAALSERGVAYRHAPELGGHREPVEGSANGAWREPAFRGYADHAATAEFRSALAELLRSADEQPTVAMCAEADPCHCHRRLLADAAVAAGAGVEHVLADGGRVAHELDSRARVGSDGVVTYPRDGGQLDLFGGAEA